jgi:hypothetical protein
MNYTRMAATVTRLLAANGTRAVLSRVSPTTGAATDRTAAVVRWKQVKHVMPGSNLQVGDWQCIVEPSADPRPGDRFTIDDENLVIVGSVEPIRPASTILAFIVYARVG